jgi:hypothetical protein
MIIVDTKLHNNRKKWCFIVKGNDKNI